jgi:two-component system phosphate regulon sensor histidine kinase PhoR
VPRLGSVGIVGALTVITRPRAYLGLIFLLSRLPLGAAYWALLGIGTTMGVSLLPAAGIGLLVLFATLVAAWWCAVFERELGIWWLGFELTPMSPPTFRVASWWGRLRGLLTNRVTWKSLVYLALQLPLGALSVAVLGHMLALSASLALAPVFSTIDSLTYHGGGPAYHPLLLVGPLGGLSGLAGTPLFPALGLALFLVTLHLAELGARAYEPLMRGLLATSKSQLQLAAARAEAAAQLARAERSDQSRRELIVNVSHELRTPIASIRGHVEALLDPGGQPSAEERTRYLEVVSWETERLGSLVDDLLAIARADSGELKLNLEPIDVGRVVAHVHEALAPIARRERKVMLLSDVAPGVPPAWGDRDRLAQVVMNLVRNAITYSFPGGMVSIQAAPRDPDLVALAVADTGVGMSPEELGRVFDRFYRTDSSRSRATGGFGLGLAITKELVEAMGGRVTAESEPGRGSRFTVLLRRVG